MKTIARITVIKIPKIAADRFRRNSAWWPYVTVAPLLTRRIVFISGTLDAISGVIPTGGHWEPSSTVGDSDEWKSLKNI